jgi:hypothetical protein
MKVEPDAPVHLNRLQVFQRVPVSRNGWQGQGGAASNCSSVETILLPSIVGANLPKIAELEHDDLNDIQESIKSPESE